MLAKIRVFIMLLSIFGVMGITDVSTMTLPTSDIRVTVPEGWVFLTQDEKVVKQNAAAFGQTPEDAMVFMKANSYQLHLYDPSSKAQLYLAVLDSPYAKQLGAIADMTPEHRQILYDMLLADYPGWVNDSGMGVYEAKEMTYLTTTMHFGEDGSRTDDRQMFTYWGSKAVFIDLYAPHDAMTEKLVEQENRFVDRMVYDISQKRENGRQQIAAFVTIVSLIRFGIIAIGLSMVAYLRARKLA